MARIRILVMLSCVSAVMSPFVVCAGERLHTPPIEIARDLSSCRNEVELGLSAVEEEHEGLDRAIKDRVGHSIKGDDERIRRIVLRDLRAVAGDHRIDIRIGRQATIVPPGSALKRAMLGMVQHPDGTIFLNLQTQPVLLTSRDNGKTWARLPIKLPDAPPRQVIQGLGVSDDGHLWLMHQSPGGRDLFVSVSAEHREGQGSGGPGLDWTTTRIDYARLAPNPQRPFALCSNDYNTFFQEPDGAWRRIALCGLERLPAGGAVTTGVSRNFDPFTRQWSELW